MADEPTSDMRFDRFVSRYYGILNAAPGQHVIGKPGSPGYDAGQEAAQRFRSGALSPDQVAPIPGADPMEEFKAIGQFPTLDAPKSALAAAPKQSRSHIRYQLPGGEWREYKDGETVSLKGFNPSTGAYMEAEKQEYGPGMMVADRVAGRAMGKVPLKPGSERYYRKPKAETPFQDRIPTEFEGSGKGGFVQALPSDEDRLLAGYFEAQRQAKLRDMLDPAWQDREIEGEKAMARDWVNERQFGREQTRIDELDRALQQVQAEAAAAVAELQAKKDSMPPEQFQAEMDRVNQEFETRKANINERASLPRRRQETSFLSGF